MLPDTTFRMYMDTSVYAPIYIYVNVYIYIYMYIDNIMIPRLVSVLC